MLTSGGLFTDSSASKTSPPSSAIESTSSSSSTPAPSSSASPTLLLPLQDHKPPSNFTAILSTNKKINSEAKGYYFSHNTFAVGNHTGDTTDPPSTLTKFINTAAKEDLNVISSIEIVLFAALIDDNCCTLLRNSMRARFLAFVRDGMQAFPRRDERHG